MMFPSSSPGPTFSPPVNVVSFSTKSSWIESSRNSRVAAVQICPAFMKTPSMDVRTAVSRSASENTMFGLLPPSSSDTRLIDPAAPAMILRPTSREPVNAILSTSGCSTIAAPVVPDDGLGEPPELRLFLARRRVAPASVLESGARGPDGPVHVLRARERDFCQNALGRGVDRVEGASTHRVDPATIDPQLLGLP